MRDKFTVTGFFYEEGQFKLRKFLDIRDCNSSIDVPDLMVVMMNPGSSRPIDDVDDSRTPTGAISDDTQSQIMKVMINAGFKYARILNLSDLRTPKSEDLYDFLGSADSDQIRHSIFDPKRESDFAELFVKDVPTIYAWGVSEALRELALSAISKISHPNPVGWKKEHSSFGYYHPLPPSTPKQIKWVEKISEMFNGT